MHETLGQRIRRLREQRRWSQRDLADLLEVSSKTIGNWENDRNDPRSSLGALEAVFGQSLDGPTVAVDPVVEAIEEAALSRGNKKRLIGAYYDMLDEHATERGDTG